MAMRFDMVPLEVVTEYTGRINREPEWLLTSHLCKQDTYEGT